MDQSRKRSRDDMDCDECLPISKRINRLQIGGNMSNVEGNNNLQVYASPMPNGGPPWPQNGEFSGVNSELSSSTSWHQNHDSHGQLSPAETYNGPGASASLSSLQVNHNLNSQYPANVLHQLESNQLSPNFNAQSNQLVMPGQEGQDLEELGPYEPELNKDENPHYFAANEILYNAHLHRHRRVGQKTNDT